MKSETVLAKYLQFGVRGNARSDAVVAYAHYLPTHTTPLQEKTTTMPALDTPKKIKK